MKMEFPTQTNICMIEKGLARLPENFPDLAELNLFIPNIHSALEGQIRHRSCPGPLEPIETIRKLTINRGCGAKFLEAIATSFIPNLTEVCFSLDVCDLTDSLLETLSNSCKGQIVKFEYEHTGIELETPMSLFKIQKHFPAASLTSVEIQLNHTR